MAPILSCLFGRDQKCIEPAGINLLRILPEIIKIIPAKTLISILAAVLPPIGGAGRFRFQTIGPPTPDSPWRDSKDGDTIYAVPNSALMTRSRTGC
jgi:hypothetical protein